VRPLKLTERTALPVAVSSINVAVPVAFVFLGGTSFAPVNVAVKVIVSALVIAGSVKRQNTAITIIEKILVKDISTILSDKYCSVFVDFNMPVA